jgi:hypothetical protein
MCLRNNGQFPTEMWKGDPIMHFEAKGTQGLREKVKPQTNENQNWNFGGAGRI